MDVLFLLAATLLLAAVIGLVAGCDKLGAQA
jgi:hypothetical protein